MNLKPQDILVVLKLVSAGFQAYGALASQLGMSASEVHAAVKRAAMAGLLETSDPDNRHVQSNALLNFLIHGVPRAFPAEPGPITLGMPTAHATSPLSSIIAMSDLPPVWPEPDGMTRGYEIKPLYKAAPGAAKRDPLLYELLALVDGLRAGRARERNAAISELRRRIVTMPIHRIPMGPFGITENEIEAWTDSYTGSEAILPDLIRRLLYFFVPRGSLEKIRFPAHKTNQPGYDGILMTRTPTIFANTEASVWEISTRKDMEVKANNDFAVRTENPLNWEKASTTYIALTSRIWKEAKRSAWIRKRKEEGGWADVRIYDAVDIAQWLTQAHPVHYWFCSMIGRPVKDLYSIKDYFDSWSARTSPCIEESVVLSGRDSAFGRIESWLKGTPRPFHAKADTNEEAVIFLCASILTSGEPVKSYGEARTVIVRSERAWQQMLKTIAVSSDSPLILVPAFSGFDEVLTGTEKHHVFVPLEKGTSLPSDTSHMELRPIVREALAESLCRLIPDADRATRLAYDCGGKLTVLQRLLGYSPPDPEWTVNEDPDLLSAILLAGAWNPGNPSDIDILVKLAGVSDYNRIEKLAAKLMFVPDPPLRRQGYIIKWRSNHDAWQRLASKLMPSLIERFIVLCAEILSEISPTYNLPSQDISFASLRPNAFHESDSIRKGIAESLAYLRYNSTNLWNIPSSFNATVMIDKVIQTLLQGDWRTWATLNPLLPTLAEASPSKFLNAIEEGLNKPSNNLGMLFPHNDNSSDISGECRHVGLLWALEGLAWHEKYFTRIVLILSRLCEIDNRRRVADSPEESLKSLFHPSYKQTSCPNESRIESLHTLKKHNSSISWVVVRHILKICAQRHSVSSNYRPEFVTSDLPEPLEKYSLQETVEFIRKICDLANDLFSFNIDRILDLFEYGGAQTVIQDLLLHIRSNGSWLKTQKSSSLLRLQDLLRKWISGQYITDDDSHSRHDQIEEAIKIINDIESDDPVESARWLFSHHATLPEPTHKHDYWCEMKKRIHEMRLEAISRLLNEPDGFQHIARMSDIVEDARLVGLALAELPESEQYDEAVIHGPLSQEGKRKRSALAYIARRTDKHGVKWIIDLASRLCNENMDQIAIDVLTAVNGSAEIRNWVDAQSEELQTSFWSRVSLWSPEVHDDIDFARTTDRILFAHRWDEAINLASWALNQDKPVGKPVDYLRILNHPLEATNPGEINGQSATYVIPKIFHYLDGFSGVKKEDLAKLELHYLDTLKSSERPARYIMLELENNPQFFSDCICKRYGPDSKSETTYNLSEDERSIQEQAGYHVFKLLYSWTGYPGKDLSPQERSSFLRQWCDQALNLVKASDRKLAGQQRIGEVLSRVPPCEIDGVWPCKVARDYLEEGYPEMARGLEIARYNEDSGTTLKPLTLGGDQERKVAIDYQKDADKIRNRYPRTAELLDRMAQHYLHLADYKDREAEKYIDP